MQRAQDDSTELVPEPPSPRPGLSPAIAFALLAIVVAVIAAAAFLTRPQTEVQAAATNPTSTSPNFALTNEEAIARFQELHEIYRHASMDRDVSAVELLFTQTSPNRTRAVRDIRQLVRDGVLDNSRFKTLSVDVIHMSDTTVSISQEAIIRPSFIDEDTGEELARTKPTHDRVTWVLKVEDGRWLVHKIEVTASEVLKP